MRWLGHVVLVATWLVIALMALLTWGPHLTRYKTDIIIGRSMEPTIPLWSVIVAEPVDPAEIRTGDVIVAQPPALDGRKVTHRVIEVVRSPDGLPSFATQGDNNDTADPWTITYEQTAWRVDRHVPHVGWIMARSQTGIARVFLVVLPVLLVLVHVLRWIWRDERADERSRPAAVQWEYFDHAAPETSSMPATAVEPLPDPSGAHGEAIADEASAEHDEESHDEPVHTHVPAPARLRVDEPVAEAPALVAAARAAAPPRGSNVARVVAIAVPLALVALGAGERRRRGRSPRR